MVGKEALNKLSEYIGHLGGGETQEWEDVILRDLEVLEILKPRISLKDSSLKNTYFAVGENGLPKLQQNLKDVDVAFIEASGFVFKNSDEYNLLKNWLNSKEE